MPKKRIPIEIKPCCSNCGEKPCNYNVSDNPCCCWKVDEIWFYKQLEKAKKKIVKQ